MKSARLKLARAEEHLTVLDAEIRRYFDSKPHRVTKERYEQNRGAMFVEVIRDFPEAIATLAGDAAHNLRSAPDHVVYAVSRSRFRRGSYFPVCTCERDYLGPRDDGRPARRSEGLGGVPEKLLAVFDAAQPYVRGDDAAKHPLACVTRLDNADKHRAIQPASAIVDVWQSVFVQTQPRPDPTVSGVLHIDWLAQGVRLALGKQTKVLEWTIDPPPPPADVRVQIEPRIDVSFGKRTTMADLYAARDLIAEQNIGPVEAKIS
ncbi:MAG: hypothetical protein ACJ744_14515 [Gaiellaceae bacterium]